MSKYFAKILGNDPESLQMIAALSSGAKVKVSDIKYLASNKVFLLSIERMNKEKEQDDKKNSVMRFDFINKVKSKNIDQSKQENILELLSIDYLKNNNDYEIILSFNNNAQIVLSSDTLECRLEDQSNIKFMKILNAQTKNFYSELDKIISKRNKIDFKTLKT
tara:strand:- start:1008 stop:1496 length:489 start_codon:yes stop_codon:yes gene_type:complete